MSSPAATHRRFAARVRSAWWSVPLGVVLVAATLTRLGLDADAAAFALVQVALLVLAVIDLETRRLPNVITVPISLAAIILRGVFERSMLDGALLAGFGALAVFGVLAVILRGGLGMGDVKLASMLGFALGSAVVAALLVGILAGGVAALVAVALRRASLDATIAYGPYLALGGAVAILVGHPPALV